MTYIILKMQNLEKFMTEKAPIHAYKRKLIQLQVSVSWCKNKETKKREVPRRQLDFKNCILKKKTLKSTLY